MDGAGMHHMPPMEMMPMTFSWSTTGKVLFDWWDMSGPVSLFLSCVVVVLVSVVKVSLQVSGGGVGMEGWGCGVGWVCCVVLCCVVLCCVVLVGTRVLC